MTFVALLTSWQFWLVNTIFCSMAFGIGYIWQGFMRMNDPPERCTRLHADEYGLELVSLRAEGRRLQEQCDALNVINADLQDQIDDFDREPGIEPGEDMLPELLRREPERRPNEAAD